MTNSQAFNAKFKNIYKPVDIIIPFHGNYHVLGSLIESILTRTMGIYYTVTLVDDASPNKDYIVDLEKKKLKKIPFQYIRLPEQQGFGAALHAGFKATQNDWVCFLHADCFIERTDWLINIMTTMHSLKDSGVKLVSAKVNDGGTGTYDPNIIGTIENRSDTIADNPLPLICAVTHRQLFDHIGGFIRPYPYGWYEDEELFWRMKIKNFRQAVCGSSFVRHYGGVAMQDFIKNPKIMPILEANQAKYVEDIRAFAKQNKA